MTSPLFPTPPPGNQTPGSMSSLHVTFPLFISSSQMWPPTFESWQEKSRLYLRHQSVNPAGEVPTCGLSKTRSSAQEAWLRGCVPQEVGQDVCEALPPAKAPGRERQLGWARPRWRHPEWLENVSSEPGLEGATARPEERKSCTEAPGRGKDLEGGLR